MALRVFKAISDLKMVVEVGLVVLPPKGGMLQREGFEPNSLSSDLVGSRPHTRDITPENHDPGRGRDL